MAARQLPGVKPKEQEDVMKKELTVSSVGTLDIGRLERALSTILSNRTGAQVTVHLRKKTEEEKRREQPA